MSRLWLALSFLLLAATPVYAATGVGLRFDPTNINMNPGDQSVTKVWLDAGSNQVVGVDLVVRFDAGKIRVSDAGSDGAFSSQTGKVIDNTNGVIRLSVSNNYGVYSSGIVDVAWIKFSSLGGSGNTSLSIDFTPGNTRDTNVVTMHGQDVLEQVSGMDVNISATGSTVTPMPGLSGTPEPTAKTPPMEKLHRPTATPGPTAVPKPTKVSKSDKGGEGNGGVKGAATEVWQMWEGWTGIGMMTGLVLVAGGGWLLWRMRKDSGNL